MSDRHWKECHCRPTCTSTADITCRRKCFIIIYYKIVHRVQLKHIKGKVETNTEKIQKNNKNKSKKVKKCATYTDHFMADSEYGLPGACGCTCYNAWFFHSVVLWRKVVQPVLVDLSGPWSSPYHECDVSRDALTRWLMEHRLPSAVICSND